MNHRFSFRLVLDLIAAGLLLFAFAYHWQGNAAHEVAGVAVFLLIAVHGMFHRRWFAGVSKASIVRRGRFNVTLTFVLLTGMIALLISSPLVSETIFPNVRLDDDFMVRRAHAGIAYWLLLIVAVHLGLRWPLLMAVFSRMAGIASPTATRTAVMRLVSAGVAVQGVFSAHTLDLPTRLLFQMSLDWWNFEESVAEFFGHCAAVASLCIVLTYYAMRWIQRLGRAASPISTAQASDRIPARSTSHHPQSEGRT